MAFEDIGFKDPFAAKEQLLDGCRSPVIFDIGAYHGEMGKYYRTRFPNSVVYCFEPFPEGYQTLVSGVISDTGIKTFNLGLSDASGDAEFFSNCFAPTNTLLRAALAASETWGLGVLEENGRITAKFTTLDEFTSQHAIDRIDILKLDVQGAEHRVLQGGSRLFRDRRVKLIYSELIIMPTYSGQLDLHEAMAHYHNNGFRLHSIYNPSFAPNGAIRQFDALFHLA